jgi:curved DNA-binding protein CbpA
VGEDRQFIDYYDVLQISPNAETDTIRKVFRLLAKKCHPDLPGGGDPERFHLLLNAHNILIDDARRAAYDLRYQDFWDKKWQITGQPGDGKSLANDTEIRERLLSLLYAQRRTNPRSPGLGDMELSVLVRIPMELMEFELWYLREKGLVERLDTGLLAISVAGVDHYEESSAQLDKSRLLEAKNPAA